MTSQYKICNECGEKVEMDYNFCPNCKSQSFRQSNVPAKARSGNPSIVHALLYWNYDGEYVIAKTKIVTIGIFVFLLIYSSTTPNFAEGIAFSAIITLFAFLFGYLLHYFSRKPREVILENNDFGALEDLKHLFFYWQNKNTGEFVLSKTKIISAVVFVILFLSDIFVPESNLFTMCVIGIVFTIPVFAVGYVIHMLTNSNPTNPPAKVEAKKPKQVKEVKKIDEKAETPKFEKALIPEFENYKAKISSLQVEFDAKEEVARDLIEKRFQPPQLTYTRFISLVDKSSKIFNKESESAMNILNLATEDSPRVDSEIKSKIETMKSIISKIDDLTNELVLSMDSDDDGDVDMLIDDMEDMIGSIKDYK